MWVIVLNRLVCGCRCVILCRNFGDIGLGWIG